MGQTAPAQSLDPRDARLRGPIHTYLPRPGLASHPRRARGPEIKWSINAT